MGSEVGLRELKRKERKMNYRIAGRNEVWTETQWENLLCVSDIPMFLVCHAHIINIKFYPRE